MIRESISDITTEASIEVSPMELEDILHRPPVAAPPSPPLSWDFDLIGHDTAQHPSPLGRLDPHSITTMWMQEFHRSILTDPDMRAAKALLTHLLPLGWHCNVSLDSSVVTLTAGRASSNQAVRTVPFSYDIEVAQVQRSEGVECLIRFINTVRDADGGLPDYVASLQDDYGNNISFSGGSVSIHAGQEIAVIPFPARRREVGGVEISEPREPVLWFPKDAFLDVVSRSFRKVLKWFARAFLAYANFLSRR